MSSPVDPPAPERPEQPERPSLLWPIFAVLAWGMLLYQTYGQIPVQHQRLRELNVPLPDVSRWTLENAHWLAPGIGIVTVLATGWIRSYRPRWMLMALVPVMCLLTLLAIQWFALLALMAGDHPRGL